MGLIMWGLCRPGCVCTVHTAWLHTAYSVSHSHSCLVSHRRHGYQHPAAPICSAYALAACVCLHRSLVSFSVSPAEMLSRLSGLANNVLHELSGDYTGWTTITSSEAVSSSVASTLMGLTFCALLRNVA